MKMKIIRLFFCFLCIGILGHFDKKNHIFSRAIGVTFTYIIKLCVWKLYRDSEQMIFTDSCYLRLDEQIFHVCVFECDRNALEFEMRNPFNEHHSKIRLRFYVFTINEYHRQIGNIVAHWKLNNSRMISLIVK